MPEAESELIAGYHTEYSGMRFGLFFLAEYTAIFGVSCLGTALFLGAGSLPFTSFPKSLLGVSLWTDILVNLFTIGDLPRQGVLLHLPDVLDQGHLAATAG